MIARLRNVWIPLLVLNLTVMNSCGDDDPAVPQATPKSKAVVASVDYTSIDIRLDGYPAGSVLALRSNHWSTAELNADPQARVRLVAGTVYRVEFLNLGAGSFIGSNAKIRLVVQDSVVDDLAGVVVLCDTAGPLDISNCAGDCDPLCGIDDCTGCTGPICR